MPSRQCLLDSIVDRDEWLTVLKRLPVGLRDAYHHPDYVSLYCRETASRAILFAYESRDELWVYPFLMREIPSGWLGVNASPRFDIETAYGYGGPLSSTSGQDFLRRAQSAFESWCREAGIVAEFVRFHPMLQTHLWYGGTSSDVIADRETYSVQLSLVDDHSWPSSASARNKLRRAEREGVRVRASVHGVDFEKFVSLYRVTMERLNADPFYYFDDAYFNDLWSLIVSSGCLLIAELDEELVGGAMFLRGDKGVHYHLSASNPSMRIPGVMNALLKAAVTEHQKRGYSWLHMGGGLDAKEDDSLAVFKRSMSTSTHTYRVGRRVHDTKTYNHLKDRWIAEHPQLVAKYRSRLLCYRHRPN